MGTARPIRSSETLLQGLAHAGHEGIVFLENVTVDARTAQLT